jgi:hypothetical protein
MDGTLKRRIVLSFNSNAVQPYCTHNESLGMGYVDGDKYDGHYFGSLTDAMKDYCDRCAYLDVPPLDGAPKVEIK